MTTQTQTETPNRAKLKRIRRETAQQQAIAAAVARGREEGRQEAMQQQAAAPTTPTAPINITTPTEPKGNTMTTATPEIATKRSWFAVIASPFKGLAALIVRGCKSAWSLIRKAGGKTQDGLGWTGTKLVAAKDRTIATCKKAGGKTKDGLSYVWTKMVAAFNWTVTKVKAGLDWTYYVGAVYVLAALNAPLHWAGIGIEKLVSATRTGMSWARTKLGELNVWQNKQQYKFWSWANRTKIALRLKADLTYAAVKVWFFERWEALRGWAKSNPQVATGMTVIGVGLAAIVAWTVALMPGAAIAAAI